MQPEPNTFLSNRPSRLEAIPWSHHDWFVLRKLRNLLKKHIDLALQEGRDLRVLDFGCADSPYEALFKGKVDFVKADLPGNSRANVEIQPDGRLAIESKQFDVIISTQVLEHVASPSVYLSECQRLLKHDGRLILTTHGIWPYHADPVDYWRWTEAGLRRQVESESLSIETLESIGGMLATAVQLFQADSAWRLPNFLRGLYCFMMQRLVAILDKFYSEAGRKRNAMVYVLTATNQGIP